jgi:hypothetical protein
VNFGTTQTRTQWGAVGDIPVPGDYDGDGITDIAVWRPSSQLWYIIPSSTGVAFAVQWGLPGDVPIAGADYDGDGRSDLAIWRPASGDWYTYASSSHVVTVQPFGVPGDIPLIGDYDGDSKTDYVIWRPSDQMWFIRSSSTGNSAGFQWGLPGDIPVSGDYDGDRITDFTVFRPTEGAWYVLNGKTGSSRRVLWGVLGDIPVSGDFDGDGTSDFAVFRPSNGTWYVIYSSSGVADQLQWGLPGDIPIGATLIAVPDGKQDLSLYLPKSSTPPSEPSGPTQPSNPSGPTTPVTPSGPFHQVLSTTAGGPATSPSTWVGGQVPGANQQAVITGPVVLNSDWTTGVFGIIVNGGSFTSDGNPHTLSIGSYGKDPVGASCGGSVGNPGGCANMFGIVQTGNGGAVNLSNVTIVTPDGTSPIYTRNQVYGNHPSDFTLKNCTIQNLGTSGSSNAYSGMVFATLSLPTLNVTVDNCTINKYYRLLYGGTANGIQSSLTWTNNRSEHGSAMDYGSITLTSAGFRRTNISNSTDWHTDGSGMYVYSYDIGFSPVIHEIHVQGGANKRGVYAILTAAQGTGNASITDNTCLNPQGAKGALSCVSIRNTMASDVNTVISGLVSTGNWETVALRPINGDRSTPIHVTNSFLSENYNDCADQGIIMIGGMSPVITNNILRVANTSAACRDSFGFFNYLGTTNSVVDNNTIIGQHAGNTVGAYFGESGFGVYNQKARNNILMTWDACVNDNNRTPSESSYSPDADTGAGVHHNATFDCAHTYNDHGGAYFKNSSGAAHPNYSAYGDVDGVNPAFADPSYRDPYKYDAQFGGTGNGEWLFSQFAAGQLTTAQLRAWIFAGYAPTSQNYRSGGYQGTYIGAVQPQ